MDCDKTVENECEKNKLKIETYGTD